MVKYGLLIGNDILNVDHYGSDYRLNAPQNDINSLSHICSIERIDIGQPLINHSAQSVISHLDNLSRECRSGDFLLIYFSGHGTQFPDSHRVENDGLNESWCLWDRCLVDNEINNILANFNAGVWILIISDSCHSGSVAELRPSSYDGRKNKAVSGVYERNRNFYDNILAGKPEIEDVSPSVILLSACQENELATEFGGRSEYTTAMMDVWNHGNFKGGYDRFTYEIGRKTPGKTPSLNMYGNNDIRFLNSRPFKNET